MASKMCAMFGYGYFCTEPPHHEGDHVARRDGAELRRWKPNPYSKNRSRLSQAVQVAIDMNRCSGKIGETESGARYDEERGVDVHRPPDPPNPADDWRRWAEAESLMAVYREARADKRQELAERRAHNQESALAAGWGDV